MRRTPEGLASLLASAGPLVTLAQAAATFGVSPRAAWERLAAWRRAGLVTHVTRDAYWLGARLDPFDLAVRLVRRPAYVSLASALWLRGLLPAAPPVVDLVAAGEGARYAVALVGADGRSRLVAVHVHGFAPPAFGAFGGPGAVGVDATSGAVGVDATSGAVGFDRALGGVPVATAAQARLDLARVRRPRAARPRGARGRARAIVDA